MLRVGAASGRRLSLGRLAGLVLGFKRLTIGINYLEQHILVQELSLASGVLKWQGLGCISSFNGFGELDDSKLNLKI